MHHGDGEGGDLQPIPSEKVGITTPLRSTTVAPPCAPAVATTAARRGKKGVEGTTPITKNNRMDNNNEGKLRRTSGSELDASRGQGLNPPNE